MQKSELIINIFSIIIAHQLKAVYRYKHSVLPNYTINLGLRSGNHNKSKYYLPHSKPLQFECLPLTLYHFFDKCKRYIPNILRKY